MNEGDLTVVMAIRVAPAATEAGADIAARMTALPGAEASGVEYPWRWSFSRCDPHDTVLGLEPESWKTII